MQPLTHKQRKTAAVEVKKTVSFVNIVLSERCLAYWSAHV